MFGDQSGFAPEIVTTFAHFSVSSAMNLPNSAGDIGVGTPPRSANRAGVCCRSCRSMFRCRYGRLRSSL